MLSHIPNKGHWNLCNIPILPVSEDHQYGSRFSHDTESSSPGFYGVTLEDYNVDVKLTATLRGGFHQYQYALGAGRFYLIWPGPTIMCMIGALKKCWIMPCRVSRTWERKGFISHDLFTTGGKLEVVVKQ